MDFETYLRPGMTGEKAEPVTEKNTALAWGSGGLAVYATPAMAALLEGAAVAAVDGALPPGFSTVGVDVEIRHLSATPPGMTVRAQARLVELDGRRLRFVVEAWDGAGKIGEGVHGRVIVEDEKFLQRAGEKMAPPREGQFRAAK
jgi:predicted thioesterase